MATGISDDPRNDIFAVPPAPLSDARRSEMDGVGDPHYEDENYLKLKATALKRHLRVKKKTISKPALVAALRASDGEDMERLAPWNNSRRGSMTTTCTLHILTEQTNRSRGVMHSQPKTEEGRPQPDYDEGTTSC